MAGNRAAQILVHNRRGQYRVRPSVDDRLTLALMRGEQRLVPDSVADVTSHGASVRFDSDLSPGLTSGETLKVLIHSPNLREGTVLPAHVSSLRNDNNTQLVGLAFDDASALIERAGQEFFRLFNRRAAERGVEPESSDAIEVVLKPLATARNNELRFPVRIRNISATGICIVVDEAADEFLRQRVQIRIAIKLPDLDEPHDIAAEVRYRATDAGKVHYGCYFDWAETVAPLDLVEELTAYALNRFEQDYRRQPH